MFNLPALPAWLPRTVEAGAPLCEDAFTHAVLYGDWRTGDHNRVEIPLNCRAGQRLIGTVHTHPDGVSTPSMQDINEGLRNMLSWIVVVQPMTGDTMFARLM